MSAPRTLKRELGLVNVYALSLGTTLSAGFFLLPGIAATEAGPAVVLSYLIAAVPLVPAMLSMIELATAMPRAGGAYYFLDRSMGPLAGTIGGLGTWIALSLKTAFALIGMGAYLGLFLPGLPMTPVAVALALAFGWINLRGAKGAGNFQVGLVGGMVLLLAGFIATGLFDIHPAHFDGFFAAGSDKIVATAGLVYISYVGVTKIASVAEEVRDPERNLPLGVILALATAIAVYGLGTFVMVGVVPPEELRGDLTLVATTARAMVGTWGVVLVTIAAMLAFFSVANAGILSASRYPFAMSRDHLLPPYFRHMDANGTPTRAIYVTLGLILFLIVAFDPTKIAKLASGFQLFLFAFLCLAVIVMRESRIESYDPGFRSPLYPWMQIFGILASLFLIGEIGALSMLFTLGLVVGGVLWYKHYARERVARDGAIYHVFARLGEKRFEALDRELRGIMKEKGLREHDPFDVVVARAVVLEAADDATFESLVQDASVALAERAPGTVESFVLGFTEGTRVGATPVSRGAALPHMRSSRIEQPELVLIRSRAGVVVDLPNAMIVGEDADKPIHAFFFLLSPESDPGQHLRILAEIAGRVDGADFMHAWLDARDAEDLREILLRDERFLTVTVETGAPTGGLVGKQVRELAMPQGCLIALVRREGESVVPQGSTALREGDRLTLIGQPEGIRDLRSRYAAA